jgi:putative transposase
MLTNHLLYISLLHKGILINADVNGAFQILKKVFPNAYANGIEAVVFQPVKVNFG